MSASSEYFEYPIQVDKGRLGKLDRHRHTMEATLFSIIMLSDRDAREPVKDLQHVACYVTEFGYSTNIIIIRRAAKHRICSR